MRPPESFIQQPIRNLQTMLRVISEDDPSLPTVVPDGIYGQTTLGAITEFQRREGLPITGITDMTTWDLLVDRYEDAVIRVDQAESLQIIMDPGQVFTLGDTGPYIYLLQSILIGLSDTFDLLIPVDHTGQYDQMTQKAVQNFQHLAGLEPTGQLDKITWKHLARHFTLNAHHNSSRQVLNNTE